MSGEFCVSVSPFSNTLDLHSISGFGNVLYLVLPLSDTVIPLMFGFGLPSHSILVKPAREMMNM